MKKLFSKNQKCGRKGFSNTKKSLALLAIFAAGTTRAFTTGYPVFDSANWLGGIDRFYQGYDQIMNTIEMIEQNYQKIQMAIEEAKSFRFEDLDFDDGSFMKNLDIRDEIRDATSQVNTQLSNIRTIRDTFEKSEYTVGGVKFTMKDLAGLGEKDKNLVTIIRDAAKNTAEDMKAAYRAVAEGLSEEEKKVIWAKYGLSPENFAMVKDIEKQVQKVASDFSAAVSEDVRKANMEALHEKTTAIIQKIWDTPEGESMTEKEIAQINALMQKLQTEQLQYLADSLQTAMSYTVWKDRLDNQTKEAKNEQQKAVEQASQEKEGVPEIFEE